MPLCNRSGLRKYAVCCADNLDDLSFTELLNMDLDADEADVAPVPASSSQQQEALPGVSSVTRPRSRRGGPGTAPKGSRPPQQSAAVSSQVFLLLPPNSLPVLVLAAQNQKQLALANTLSSWRCRQ